MLGSVPARAVIGELAREPGGTGLGSQAINNWSLVEWPQKKTVGKGGVQVRSLQFSLQSTQHLLLHSLLPLRLASAWPTLCRK